MPRRLVGSIPVVIAALACFALLPRAGAEEPRQTSPAAPGPPSEAVAPSAPRSEATTGANASSSPPGVEDTRELCQDGLDNDGDGKIDCADEGCKDFRFCVHPEPENTALRCQDHKDNDGDGKTDCDDSDCADFIFCARATSSAPRPAETTPPGSTGAVATTSAPAAVTLGPRRGLVAAGIVLLSVGYGISAVASVITTIVDEQQKSSAGGAACLSSSPMGFIPVVGALLYLKGYPSYAVFGPNRSYYDCPGSRSTVTALAATSTAMQFLGTGAIVLGLAWRVRVPGIRDRVTLSPIAPNGGTGLALTGSF